MRSTTLLLLCLPVCLTLLAFLGSACSTHQAPEQLSEGEYEIGKPLSKEWKYVNPGGADKAWYNESLAASIYADSNCGARTDESRLPAMVDHLLFGVSEPRTLEQREFTLSGREAMFRALEGKMDGVHVRLGVVVTRKHNCTYDFVYIAQPSRFAQGLPDFMAVVEGFGTFGSP